MTFNLLKVTSLIVAKAMLPVAVLLSVAACSIQRAQLADAPPSEGAFLFTGRK
jgi:hypothetical protein